MDEFDEYGDDLADEDWDALGQVGDELARNEQIDELLREVRADHEDPPLAPSMRNAMQDGFSNAAISRSERPAARSTTTKALAAAQQRESRTASTGASYRQVNLFGQPVHDNVDQPPTQLNKSKSFRADLPPEAPTQHELDHEALKTWIYPTNMGPIRDYQFSIVRNALFNNTLVALPTGLGKTFIAATVMLNYFRWMRKAKLVFVAPTKPLVAQQVGACFGIAGIPRSQTTLLTGDSPPALRADEWQTKRVFFMTPQTLQNDLSQGMADPKDIALLVIDEAHRATGEYAYAKVVKFIRRFSSSFRVLALTATPGSKVESVQEVISNLGISHVEIRTEESIDIRDYVHQRNIDEVVLDPSDEILLVRELFSKALKPLVDKLSAQNIYWGRDPLLITQYGLLKTKQEWMQNAGRNVNPGVKFMTVAIFGILIKMSHALKLLNFHGIKPFYDNLAEIRGDDDNSKYKQQIIQHESFREMMTKVEGWLKLEDFVSHPKVTYLCDAVLNHLMDAGDGANTGVIVFSEYRDSIEEIARILNRHRPTVRATVFVGQADSKRSEGMKQAEQMQTIERFKSGAVNVLVTSSVGEEGLDIGQVDLIICYDSSASPIRMLQRMGRTGRKRAGNILLLLMRGKEEEQYAKAKDNYIQMQKLICEGSRFDFPMELSSRIIPRDVRPVVDKRDIDIPPENTQNSSLPEPKKSTKRKKLPPKKFHMPDGVETGFRTASAFGKLVSRATTAKMAPPKPKETDELAEIPSFDRIFLTKSQTAQLIRMYAKMPSQSGQKVTFLYDLDLGKFPKIQRKLGPAVNVQHGGWTRRCVKLFRTFSSMQSPEDTYNYPYGKEDNSKFQSLPFPRHADDTDNVGDSDGEHRKRRKTTACSGKSDVDDLPTRKKASAEKGKPRNSKKSLVTSSRPKATVSALIDDGGAMDEDDEEAGSDGRIRRVKGKKKGRKAKHSQNSTMGQRRNANPVEDYGDSVERDSDALESDGSDKGSDLGSFILGDDEITSSMQRVPTSSSAPITPAVRHQRTNGSARPFYVPTSFPPTQEESDDLPDLDEFLKSKRKTKKQVISDSDSDVPAIKMPRTSRRAVFNDSDE